jgi:hypothetical protein
MVRDQPCMKRQERLAVQIAPDPTISPFILRVLKSKLP